MVHLKNLTTWAFEKVVFIRSLAASLEVNERYNKYGVFVVRGPAKQAEPFGFALIFGLHLLHQGKRWKR